MTIQSPFSIKTIIEGLIFASAEPLSLDQLNKILATSGIELNKQEIQNLLNELKEIYQDRAIELTEVASGFRFQVRKELAPWINKLWLEKPQRYSSALLEVLTLIAYKQPITRGEIEEIRGVSVSTNIINTLLEREWVAVIGYKEVPGRPALYATTKKFLDYFNLTSITDLPMIDLPTLPTTVQETNN